MVILGANLGYRLYPLQHYEYRETNKQKIGLDIVMDYINVVCKQIYIGMFVSRTKWQMQSGVKSGANTLYAKDLKLTKSSILTSPFTPQFPSSEWSNVIIGAMVDLNHVISASSMVLNNN